MLVHVHELGNQARPIGLGMLDDERLDVDPCAIEHLRSGSQQPVRGAIIDVIRLIGVVPESDLAAGKLLVVRVVGMPSKLCR